MIDLSTTGAVRRIALNRPPVNALSPALMAALRAALDEAVADDSVRAILLSGRPGMFSAGLDVPTLLGLDSSALKTAWRDFFAIMATLARSPKLCATAITGHSPAGGAVIALFTDYRVMADGPFKIGLNEVQVGLPVPRPIVQAYARLLGARTAERLIVAGEMLDPTQAEAVGLIDAGVAPDAVEAHALQWLERHLALPPRAMTLTRAVARADLAALFDRDLEGELETMARGWFHPETQRVMQALVARLKARG
jgi:Delta3-Delta2-enoyl-CoA isomerase